MKYITLIAVLNSLFGIANAQDETISNSFILGGSVNYFTQNNTFPFSIISINSGIGGLFSNSTNDTKNTTFSISPYFGREINPYLILGIQLDYRIGKFKAEDTFVFGQTAPVDFERNSNQIGIGVFTRHTLNPDKQFNLFIQPFIEYNLLNEEERQDLHVTQEEKASYIELGIDAGVLYTITDSMRATLRVGGLNYLNGKWEIIDTDTENNFSSFRANINLSTIFFGFEIKI